MVDTISELSPISTKLNQKSDQLNSLITTVKLAHLNLGIETWCDDHLKAGDYYFDYENERNPKKFRPADFLGYERLEDEWQLAVKHAVLETRVNDFGEEYEELSQAEVTPLLKASRELRIKAMKHLPKFLDALKAEAEALLAGIEEAEKAGRASFQAAEHDIL